MVAAVVVMAAEVLITAGVAVLNAEEVRDGGGDRGWREVVLVVVAAAAVVVTTVGLFALPPRPPAAVATEEEPGVFWTSPDSERGRTSLASTLDLM